jgi:4-amino-4-deoxy-L-arabinose transferase-like glycosyltransferase
MNSEYLPLRSDYRAAIAVGRPLSSFIGLCILLSILHATVLFVVIPVIGTRLRPLYNQNVYADGYDELATNLVQGHGYRFYPETSQTLMREPGYPIFLAGLFFISGYSFAAVKLANMFMALGAAWIMVLIARRVVSSKMLALVPPLLFLFHPGTLIAESRGGVEVLFALLLALFVLTMYRALEGGHPKEHLVSGGVLGLTILVKSTPILFPVLLLGYLIIFDPRGNSRLKICRNIALMVIAMFAVLSPWVVRNYSVTGKFVPTASVLGISAHAGQYINSHLSSKTSWVDLDHQASEERKRLAQKLGYPFKDVKDSYYEAFYSSDDELRFSSFLLHNVIEEYKRSPMLYVRSVRSNLFNLWFAGKTRIATRINVAVQLPYLLLAAVGIVLALRNRQFKIVAPMVLLIVYLVGVYVAILAQARYSVPMMPFLSILACVTLAEARRTSPDLKKA